MPHLQARIAGKDAATSRQATAAQDSIKASKDWFMACAGYAPGMAAQMADFVAQAPSYEKQLHVIYLANDVLLKGCACMRLHMTCQQAFHTGAMLCTCKRMSEVSMMGTSLPCLYGHYRNKDNGPEQGSGAAGGNATRRGCHCERVPPSDAAHAVQCRSQGRPLTRGKPPLCAPREPCCCVPCRKPALYTATALAARKYESLS